MVTLTHWVCFLFFLRELLMLWPPSIRVVFRRLGRLCSFPPCWRQANVTPIPKGPPSSSVANYQQISIATVLSKVYERLVSVCLGRFMERSCVLPTTPLAYRKGLGTCDVLLCMSRTLQSALESGQEARIVQIDFSAAFDRVNHQGILYKLCSVGIVGSVLPILTQFLSNRSQHVMVDGFSIRSFFPFWIISGSVMLKTHFDGCCAIPRRQSYSSRVPDP